MEEILRLITTYGLETVVIALMINVLTGIVKIPVKSWAHKLKDYTKITRFIVFLPIVLGFLLSYIYARFVKGSYRFNREFITLWMTSSSLSLTFYAVFEKIFPSDKKILTDCEIQTSKNILESIKQLVETALEQKESRSIENTEEISDKDMESKAVTNSIVLRGKIDEKINVEK